MLDEHRLISRVAQGDKEALREIYEIHAEKVYNMIFNLPLYNIQRIRCLTNQVTLI